MQPVKTPRLTHERLLQVLNYEPQTGLFCWKDTDKLRLSKGQTGGRTAAGYLLIMVDRERLYAHRLAIFYVTGQWPAAHVDHHDGDRRNNAIANLRTATPTQNMANRGQNKGKRLPKGVFTHGDRFRSAIKQDGKYRHLGCYDTIAKAQTAYLAAAQKAFGEFARA